MSDLDAVLEAIREWSAKEIEFALATVVGVRGSTYRGLGARQLVGADGAGVGTVSGGCLDRDLHTVALEVIASNNSRLVEFDLTADDEAIWGWGIGCNGATKLLVEPAGTAVALAGLLERIRAEQRATAIVHRLDDDGVGRRAVVTAGTVDGDVDAATVAAAREALGHGWSVTVESAGRPALIEVVAAPSRLVVCGAGHDAAPLVAFGSSLGFQVVVVDDRRVFLDRERFPDAASLVMCRPSELTEHVDIDERSYVVLMSHNYLRDLDYLTSLSSTQPAYVGALGPGQRLGRLLGDLAERGVQLSDDFVRRLHGPAGLDVGAEGPAEIAWSILGEIMAVRRGKDGGKLRVRKGPDLLRRLP